MLRRNLLIRKDAYRRFFNNSNPAIGSNCSHNIDDQCWNCKAKRKDCTMICTKCDKIQPIHENNQCSYFTLFNLSPTFQINEESMEKKFWSMQKKFHPDLYTNKTEKEKELSAMNSALINRAFQVLKKPHLRAQYLLKLNGLESLEELRSTTDPALLGEIMELREEMEEITNANDYAILEARIKEMINDCEKKIAKAYDMKHDIKETQEFVMRLQYLVSIAAELHEKTDIK